MADATFVHTLAPDIRSRTHTRTHHPSSNLTTLPTFKLFPHTRHHPNTTHYHMTHTTTCTFQNRGPTFRERSYGIGWNSYLGNGYGLWSQLPAALLFFPALAWGYTAIAGHSSSRRQGGSSVAVLAWAGVLVGMTLLCKYVHIGASSPLLSPDPPRNHCTHIVSCIDTCAE